MDHAAIIRAFGGADALSAALGVPYDTARKWLDRGRIPPRHWPAIVALTAGTKGLRWITCDALATGWVKAGRAA